jgi:putative RecB family exonuclease
VIDRLELDDDGELVITDYKTGSVPGERHELQRLARACICTLMVEQLLGKRPVRVQLLYLLAGAIIAVPVRSSR